MMFESWPWTVMMLVVIYVGFYGSYVYELWRLFEEDVIR